MTIHITNLMQGIISEKKPPNLKPYINIRDNSRVKIDILRTIKLKPTTEYTMELQNVSYIPFIRRNLLSMYLLDKYSFVFLQ